MKTALQQKPEPEMKQEITQAPDMAKASFTKIAPFWPLKNLIAVNPLQGLEDLPIEEALKLGDAYFQQTEIPKEMEAVNRETIKWLQAFFDDGQATIPMPLRKNGLYAAWRKLAVHDGKLHGNDTQKQEWLRSLPETSEKAIAECLLRLSIAKEDRETFLTLLLTTLPGWAAYVKYRTEWAGLDANHQHPVTQSDYLAMRLIITSLLWPEAKALLERHRKALQEPHKSPLENIQKSETTYRLPLLEKLAAQTWPKRSQQGLLCRSMKFTVFKFWFSCWARGATKHPRCFNAHKEYTLIMCIFIKKCLIKYLFLCFCYHLYPTLIIAWLKSNHLSL